MGWGRVGDAVRESKGWDGRRGTRRKEAERPAGGEGGGRGAIGSVGVRGAMRVQRGGVSAGLGFEGNLGHRPPCGVAREHLGQACPQCAG